MLTDCSHHCNASSTISAQWIFDGLLSWRPGSPVPEPQVEGGFVEVDKRTSLCDHARQLHSEGLHGALALRQGLRVDISYRQIADVVPSVKHLQALLRNLEPKIFFNCQAPLLQIVPAPLLQKLSIQQLARVIASGGPLVYFDEASFNLWLRNRRTWTPRVEPVKYPLGRNRGKGITVMGAIS